MIGAHSEIEIARRKVLKLYQVTYDYLRSKPTTFLEDLLHRAEEERFNESFSVRTAAEINRAACVLILEEQARAAAAPVANLELRNSGKD